MSFGSAPVVHLIEFCVNVYSGPYGGMERKNTGPSYRNGMKGMHRNGTKGMHRMEQKVCIGMEQKVCTGMEQKVCKWQFSPDFLFCLVKVDVRVTKDVTKIAAILCPAICISGHEQAGMGGESIKYISFVTKNTAEWGVP